MQRDWGYTQRYQAVLDPLLNEYQHHRSAHHFVTAVAAALGPDLHPALLRELNAFLLDGEQILVAVDENGQPDVSLILLTTPSQAEIVVLFDDPDQPPSTDIRSTQDLSKLLSTSTLGAQTQLFSTLTGKWPSCIMELLHFEITRTCPPPDAEYKRQCNRHLMALSKRHGVLPPSFFLHDVVRSGDRAVCGGSYSDVWQGRLNGKPICLKVIRLFTTVANRARVIKQFCREALVWKHLDHPNVLPLLGVNMELFAPSFCLISPWMYNGNLLDYLEKNPSHDRLKALLEVAEGMDYLHRYDPPIVHADIRCGNILVAEDFVCRLADFGLARVTESQPATTTTLTAGTVRWMAPELLFPSADDEWPTQNHSSRDIYAFGCTILEVYTLKPPFHYLRHDPSVTKAVIDGKRPLRPESITSAKLWDIVEQCWNADPVARPSSQHVVSLLEQLIEADQDPMPSANKVPSTSIAIIRNRSNERHNQPPDDAANDFIPSSVRTNTSESSAGSSRSSGSFFESSDCPPSVSSSPTSSIISQNGRSDLLTPTQTTVFKSSNPVIELWKLHSQLIFKPDVWVNLDLLSPQRSIIHSGKLLKRASAGHTWNRWNDFYAILLDNYLLLTQPREQDCTVQYYVDNQPIPLDLISVKHTTPLILQRDAPQRQENEDILKRHPPITLHIRGHDPTALILYADSAQVAEEWETKLGDAIKDRRQSYKLFRAQPFHQDMPPLTQAEPPWTALGPPTCFASFGESGLVAIGAAHGIWIGSRQDSRPRRVLRLEAVTQCSVLESFGIFLVLAAKTLYALDIETLTTATPHTIAHANQSPHKLTTNQDVDFFSVGQLHHGQTIVMIYVRRRSLGNVFRVLEPIKDEKLATNVGTRLFRPARTKWFQTYREFAFPSDCFGATILASRVASKVAILSTQGFEIVDLSSGDSYRGGTIPTSTSTRKSNILKRCHAGSRPLGVCRAGNEGFLLVYNDIGLYVDRRGEPRQNNSLCEWSGTAHLVGFCRGYLILVNTDFVEVRHIETSRLVQVIRGKNICSLYNSDGKVGIVMDITMPEGQEDLHGCVFEITPATP